ncbi:MAG: PQQ-binding-like beta-propeller repeat protein [Cellulosilyticaceae bacterium]
MVKRVLFKGMGLIVSMILLMIGGCQSREIVPPGSVVWRFETGGEVLSSPGFYKENVIFGSDDRNVYSINLKTQEEQWRFACNEPVRSEILVDKGLVYVTTYTACYALDVKTGKEVWRYEEKLGGADEIDSWDFHTPSPLLYKDLVIFTSQAGDLYGLDKKDGTKVWQYRGEDSDKVICNPQINGSLLAYGDIAGNGYVVDLDTQKTQLKKTIGTTPIHAALIDDGKVYFAGRDMKVVAAQLANGEEIWVYNEPKGSWFTADLFVDQGILYVPGSDNYLLLGLDCETGEVMKEIPSKRNIFAKPLLQDGMLYIPDGQAYNYKDGHILAYDMKQLDEPVWTFKVDDPIFSTPKMHKGVLYVGSCDKYFYAIQAK